MLLTTLLVGAGCGAARPAALPKSDLRVPERSVKSLAQLTRDPLRVRYTGRRTLRGQMSLRAAVRSDTRVIAVTFLLAGRPLGTLTQAPWTLDVDAALLPAGTAPLRVLAVDRLGRRATSPQTRVRVLRGGERIMLASPRSGIRAALRALARGSVTVRLAPGVYRIPEITLGASARLIGAGAATVLEPPPGGSEPAIISTRATHVRVSDLAIDGAGQSEDGVSIGDGAHDVRVQRITASGLRTNGIDVWGAHSVISVEDSTLVGGGASVNAGVLDQGSQRSSQTSVLRTRIRGFQGYGILFAQRFHGLRSAARRNLALDNQISDIIDPARHDGTDAGGIWTGGVEAAVLGNTVARTGTDGIETVGSSTRDTILGNNVRETPVAIYVEHSTNNSLIAGNRLARVGTGINVEWRHAGGGSNENTFAENRIAATQVGVFVDVQEDYNAIVGNVFVSGRATPIVLQGSSNNVVRANVVCAAGSVPLVIQQPARSQTGAIARSSQNLVFGNHRTGTCAAA